MYDRLRSLAVATISLSFTFLMIEEAKLNKTYNLTEKDIASNPSTKPSKSDDDFNPNSRKHDKFDPKNRRSTRDSTNDNDTGRTSINYGTRNRDAFARIRLVEEISKLPNIGPYLRTYYFIQFYFYLFMIIKFSFLCLLDFKLFEEYRYITCFIIGRLVVNGRVIRMTNYVGLFISSFIFVWRYVMLVYRPNFGFDCLEFLMYNYDELFVLQSKIHSTIPTTISTDIDSSDFFKQKASSRDGADLIKNDQTVMSPEPIKFNELGRLRTYSNAGHGLDVWKAAERKPIVYQSLLQYRNRFLQQSHQIRPIQLESQQVCPLRPNRTTEAWLRLAKLNQRCLEYGYSFILIIAPIFLRMIMPILTTKRGFELSYYQCTNWLINHPNQSPNYEFIYKVQKELESQSNNSIESSSRDPKNHSNHNNNNKLQQPANIATVAFLSFQDFCDWNWFHSMRICWEFCENLFMYLDTVTVFITGVTICLLAASDASDYSAKIKIRLSMLIKQLRHQDVMICLNGEASFEDKQEQTQQKFQTKTKTLIDPSMVPSSRLLIQSARDRDESFRILDLQAMLIDNFSLINTYNTFTSFVVLYSIGTWIVYSTMVSSWIFIPGDLAETPKLEWYILLTYAAICVTVILGSFARVRVASRSLYPLIVTAAALDGNCHLRKIRWLTILSYYSPKPMYCFTLFESSEISWLFLFKLVAWVFSALLVASSFFTTYSSNLSV